MNTNLFYFRVTIYNNAKSFVINNGWISSCISIERGVRQGCPLSALLFLFVVEILATKIRQDKEIHGIKVKNQTKQREIKITQMADDMQVYVTKVKSLSRVLNLIDEYGKFSGLRLNRSKTEGLKLGNWKDMSFEYISWPGKPIKALGIYFGHCTIETNKLNWDPLIEKIEILLNLWKKRKLSVFGKITILKCLALSKVSYIASMIEVPKFIIAKLNSLFYNFLWNEKKRES